MFPVLFSFGGFSISSFGVFLAIGYLFAIFLIWRLSRAWELDEEKILDLTLLTFLGGIIGARIYFAVENWSLFTTDFSKIILFYKQSGFSLWGGVLGGWLTLFYFSKKLKLDFWQIADICLVGFLGGLILADVGCLLGSCSVGIPTKFFLAVEHVGLIGKRLPVQIFEAILLTIVLFRIWKKATHFHLRGTIAAISLIFISLIKLFLEPFRANHGQNYYFLTVLLILGIVIYYKATKRNILKDVTGLANFLSSIFTSQNTRKLLLVAIKKSWYNEKSKFIWSFKNFKKGLKRLNVRFSHKNTGVN